MDRDIDNGDDSDDIGAREMQSRSPRLQKLGPLRDIYSDSPRLVPGEAEIGSRGLIEEFWPKLAEREGIRTPDTVARVPHLRRHFRQTDPLTTLSACPLRSDHVRTCAPQRTAAQGHFQT
jgi:hypothetical protein